MNENLRILLKYITIALVALGLIVAAAFCLFFWSVRYMNNSAIKECYSQLDHYQVKMENRIQEINAIIDQISVNTDILKLGSIADPEQIAAELEKFTYVNEVLRSYQLANGFVDHILIHLRDNDVVFTTNHLFFEKREGSGDFFIDEGQRLDEWLEDLYSYSLERQILSRRNIVVENEVSSWLFFVQIIPSAVEDNPLGVIVIAIKEESFVSPMVQVLQPYGGYGYVMLDGELVAASDPTTSLAALQQNEEYLEIELSSAGSCWRYHFLISNDSIQGNINQFRANGLVILIAAIALSVVVLILFLSGRYKALARILSTFCYKNEDAKQSANEMDFIHSSVDDLFQQIESFRPVLINEFWENLLRGQITTLEEAQYYLMQMEPLDLDQACLAVVLRIRVMDDLDVGLVQKLNQMKLVLDEQLRRNFPEYLHGCNIGPLVQTMICTTPPSRQELLDKLAGIAKDFEAQFGYELVYGAGDSVAGILEIFVSFCEAVISVRGVCFPQMPLASHVMSYPLTIMHKANLVRLLKSGQDEEVATYLERIFDRYYLDGEQPEWLRPQYAHALLSALLLAYNDLRDQAFFPHQEFAAKIEQAYRCPDATEQIKLAKDIQHLFSQAINKNRGKMDSHLMRKVIPFIQKNLFDYNLTLQMVADHFHVSTTYLSSHFKKHSGVNFSNYIEKLRIEASCELIRQGQSKVLEIGKQVGYHSDQVYRRAFKRIIGVSPSVYIRSLERGKSTP